MKNSIKIFIFILFFLVKFPTNAQGKNYEEMLENFQSQSTKNSLALRKIVGIESPEKAESSLNTEETEIEHKNSKFIDRGKELEAMKIRWNSLISKVSEKSSLFNFESEKSKKIRKIAKDAEKFKEFLSKNIDIDSLISAAYERNPALADAKNAWKSAVEQYSQAARLDEIMRQYRAFVKDLNTKVGPRLEKTSIMMNFPLPGTLTLKGDIISKEVEIGKEKYDVVLRNLIHDLKFYYYECTYLTHLIKIITENIRILKSLESTAYVKYNTATAPYSDIIKVQVKISKLSDDLITAKEHRITNAAKINQLLSLPPMNPLGIFEEDKLWDVSLPVEKLIKLGLSSQQELKIIRFRVQKTNLAITLAEKKFYPDLTVGYSYFENDAGNLVGTAKDRPSFSLRPVSKTSFWFGVNDAYIREARLKYQAMQKEQISLEDKLSYSVKELYYLLDKAKRSVVLYKNSLIALAQDSLKVSEAEYLAAKVDFLNVLDAQEVLLDYEIDYERSVKEQNQGVSAIEKVLGISLAHVKYKNQGN